MRISFESSIVFQEHYYFLVTEEPFSTKDGRGINIIIPIVVRIDDDKITNSIELYKYLHAALENPDNTILERILYRHYIWI